jgi:error-prone DNA polymerase
LHVQSFYSLRRGVSSPAALIARALEHGQRAVAITDHLTVAGHVPALLAARDARDRVRVILGARVPLLLEAQGGLEPVGTLVALCRNRDGYARLNRLLTLALEREEPGVTVEELCAHHGDLELLTGGRDGALRALLTAHRQTTALETVRVLQAAFGDRLWIELSHGLREGDTRANRALLRLARLAGVRAVLTNDVRYATAAEYALCDAVNRSRQALTVDDDGDDHEWNDAHALEPRGELERRIPYPAALDATLEIAARCEAWTLLEPRFRAPQARVPPGTTPAARLEALVRAGIRRRYPCDRRARALEVALHELAVIGACALEEYFLGVEEIVAAARGMGIRTAGRGSAAASIVVYCLGIAHADPLRFRLSFERFLTPERMRLEPPDIDIDVQSIRRAELVAWVVERFGRDQTAMAANHNFYGLRGAVRDMGKVLGFPLPVVERLCRAVSRHASPRRIARHRASLEAVLGGSSPLLEVLIALVRGLDGVPRDLSLHSGGMLVSPEPMDRFSARFRSTGGTWQAMLNKDSAESAGLIKIDLLGLRILDTVQGTLEALESLGIAVNLDEINFDDPLVYDAICDGEVLGLFQIESPGQQSLAAKLQPRDFPTLVAQIALHRPGAIQAGSVHPYVRRSHGEEPVTVEHHSLYKPLEETLGVIVYQDQVVEIGMSTCGWSGGVADAFRKALSKVREPEDLEPLRAQFITSALETHPDLSATVAQGIFAKIASYRGYGFPRAHSVAFGVTAYHTAWLKTYFPAAYLLNVLQSKPGMYNDQTVRGEAERYGVPVLGVCIARSAVKYVLEREGETTRLVIRQPLTTVQGVGADLAAQIVAERERAAFTSLEDFYRRVAVPRALLDNLARAGAFDVWFSERPQALWALGVLEVRLGGSGCGSASLLEVDGYTDEDAVPLEILRELERIAWDVRVAGSSRTHPIAPLRATLDGLGVSTVSSLQERRGAVTIAGLRGMVQQPGTAHGTRFVQVEDETGQLQCIVSAGAWARLEAVFDGDAVVVRGAVQRLGVWRAISVGRAEVLGAVSGVEAVAAPPIKHMF